MRETDDFVEDEVSLFDLWGMLRGGWRLVFGSVVLGVLGAVAAIAFIAPQFEAVALLQTGTVSGSMIEEPTTALERLRSPSFLREIAVEVGDSAWVDQIDAGVQGRTLVAKIQKATPSMIEVRVVTGSPDSSKKIAELSTARLIRRQTELASRVVAKVEFDISVLKEKLGKSESDLTALSKAIDPTNVKNDTFSQLSLLTSLRMQRESDSFALRQSIYVLENSLLPPLTQPARVLEDIFVSNKPVFPKKGVLLAMGLVAGLLVGVMLVFVSGAWRLARARRSVGKSPG